MPRRTCLMAPRGDDRRELVGLAIASATPYHPNVGYLGVLPEQRRRAYVDGILAEITRIHAAEGANRVTAATVATTTSMAAVFDRADVGGTSCSSRVMLG